MWSAGNCSSSATRLRSPTAAPPTATRPPSTPPTAFPRSPRRPLPSPSATCCPERDHLPHRGPGRLDALGAESRQPRPVGEAVQQLPAALLVRDRRQHLGPHLVE